MIRQMITSIADLTNKVGFQAIRGLLLNVSALTQAWETHDASYTIDPGFVCIWHILDAGGAVVHATLADPEDCPGALAIFKCVNDAMGARVISLIDGALYVDMALDDALILKASDDHGWCRLV